MRLIFVRHADPSYENDSLTPVGWEEAALLRPRIQALDIKDCYCSPLGRARDTARTALEGSGIEPVICEWMREFYAPVKRPNNEHHSSICWDWLPKDWTGCEEFFDYEHWTDNPRFAEGKVEEEYRRVTGELDRLIAEHGYVREGRMYRAVKPNNDTLVFFCHYGVTCVFLSRLLNVSPMVLWHGICMAPASLTTVITEERRAGEVYFRASAIGDTSHIYAAGREPSFSARFCECFDNTEERHD